MKLQLLLFLFISSSLSQQEDEFLYDTFPDDFMWGLATSAYQIEGGAYADGKRNVRDGSGMCAVV